MKGEHNVELLLKLGPALLLAGLDRAIAHLCFTVLDALPVAFLLFKLPPVLQKPNVS